MSTNPSSVVQTDQRRQRIKWSKAIAIDMCHTPHPGVRFKMTGFNKNREILKQNLAQPHYPENQTSFFVLMTICRLCENVKRDPGAWIAPAYQVVGAV